MIYIMRRQKHDSELSLKEQLTGIGSAVQQTPRPPKLRTATPLQAASTIVTVCVRGRKARRSESTSKRIALLITAISAITARTDGPSINAVVFPGGFFFSDTYVGHLDHEARVRRLNRTDIWTRLHGGSAEAGLEMARRLVDRGR
jgi:hypothetical protein